jgi:hypothetical protein
MGRPVTHDTPDKKQAALILQTQKKREKIDTIAQEKTLKRKELGLDKSLTHYKYEIVDKFIKGTPIPQLAEEYHYSHQKISEVILEHHKDLTNARAANALQFTSKDGYNLILEKLKATEVINDEFLLALSPSDSLTLSEAEALYAWVYVTRGDTKEAIEMSNLNTGLFKEVPVTYKRGVLSRSLYLQQKPNVAKYIKELREQRFQVDNVNKSYVQELILEQIDQVKQRGTQQDLRNMSKLIELLGKTIGAFTEKIEISEVDPSKSLDLLIDMAKKAQVKEIN